MNRIELLVHKLDHAHQQEDWHPPLSLCLNGLTAEQANWKPQGEASNSVWETVNHLLFYKERLLARLKGMPFHLSAEDNDATFTVSSVNDAAWQAVVERTDAVYRELRDALAALADEEFDRPLPKVSLGQQVISIIMHEAYHTGQIVLLRKLQGSWPAKRSFE